LIRQSDGLAVIEYAYSNTPRAMVRDRSAPHFGTARLECTSQRPTHLQGNYWTDRRTTGELTFTEHTGKVLQTFADAEAHFGKGPKAPG